MSPGEPDDRAAVGEAGFTEDAVDRDDDHSRRRRALAVMLGVAATASAFGWWLVGRRRDRARARAARRRIAEFIQTLATHGPYDPVWTRAWLDSVAAAANVLPDRRAAFCTAVIEDMRVMLRLRARLRVLWAQVGPALRQDADISAPDVRKVRALAKVAGQLAMFGDGRVSRLASSLRRRRDQGAITVELSRLKPPEPTTLAWLYGLQAHALDLANGGASEADGVKSLRPTPAVFELASIGHR